MATRARTANTSAPAGQSTVVAHTVRSGRHTFIQFLKRELSLVFCCAKVRKISTITVN